MSKKKESQFAISDFSKKVLKATIIILLCILLTILLLKGFKILLLILSGILVATFFRGIASFIQQLFSIGEKWALLIGIVSMLLTLTGTGYVLYPSISDQLNELENELPKAAKKTESKLNASPVGKWVIFQLKGYKQQYQQNSEKLTLFFSSFFGGLADIYIIFFLGLFFMVQPDVYINGFIRLFPLHRRKRAQQVIDTTAYTLKRWLLGKVFSMIVVGVLTGIGLSILGIPLALTLAIFATLVTFIPNFGPILSLIPAFLIAFTIGADYAVYVCILYAAIQALESNIITPMIQRKMISFPLALVLMAQVVLGVFTGILGLILAVPIVAIVVVLVKMIYLQDILQDDQITIENMGNKN
ncbi:AI-2E family transporter [Aquimarina brevivitae]|uniref:Putative PurR-regulated permease PerM n=1 Tax=Aquimarina brevivitae TaxID=323412 RepID=A0A4Q7PHK8_9FLAO|nr:AI-2E family transporter [Aquimarina brevivitae]RZT00037.1 putative PurR-regulated permease PerM [Aquimarina brevivitae]